MDIIILNNYYMIFIVEFPVMPNYFTKYTVILCFRIRVHLQDGRFQVVLFRPTRWFHIVVNYMGTNNSESIQLFMDGEEKSSDTMKDAGTYSAGDARIVVGRVFRDWDRDYTSLEIDELIFFNRNLILDEITSLATAT